MRISLAASNIDSSSIERIEFLVHNTDRYMSRADGHVRVTFQNGSRYVYENVSAQTVIDVLSADSIGFAFNKAIVNGGYRYEKENI